MTLRSNELEELLEIARRIAQALEEQRDAQDRMWQELQRLRPAPTRHETPGDVDIVDEVNRWIFSRRQRFLHELEQAARLRIGVQAAWPDLYLLIQPEDVSSAFIAAKAASEPGRADQVPDPTPEELAEVDELGRRDRT